MTNNTQTNGQDAELLRLETNEWLESLDYVIRNGTPERIKQLLRALQNHAARFGIQLPYAANTPYVNTIPREKQGLFPGNLEVERRLRSIIRWNALAMVVRANRNESGIGGHISTYSSCATLLEVGFNHFFRGKDDPASGGDLVYFQGHAAPGVYARAFLEGRLSEKDLVNFRRELKPGGGLCSYPHPYCMPNFWEFPTVSMGLGPIMAIYQARFNRYLEDRGLIKGKTDSKVWAFIGDGETDEPETLGAISLASREKLDNLIFVVNCNLQRLDGPVRGNYKIIQELEAVFRGAGWNVIKLIWGVAWDPLLKKDTSGALVQRMEETVDGNYQMYSASTGSYVREKFFGVNETLKKLVENYTDEEIMKFNRGGHDTEKVYAAYRSAVEHKGAPTVILAKTIKGYGLGEAGEGKNITHQQKKMNEQELRRFRSRFGIPISDEEAGEAPFYRPSPESEEMRYLTEKRKKLGGSIPRRTSTAKPLPLPPQSFYDEFYQHQGGPVREVSTTMVFVRLLGKLLRDPGLGRYIVPIIPDEARTFGMEALFRQVGIYSHIGQRYEPVDKDTLLYYKEAVDGQIIEEGITEAGSISSFIAAGTAYASHNVNMIPFFIYYSMFGFQRIGDAIWAAGDIGCRGFLIGGTAGRTTLAGEGLQHQDGHSHLIAYTCPHVRAYDPAFAHEIAVIVEDGLKQMVSEQKNVVYYITVGNEPYEMPSLPPPSPEMKKQILSGMYPYKKIQAQKPKASLQILASGSLIREALRAAQVLAEDWKVTVDVWSVTSYKQLFLDLLDTERHNSFHPHPNEQKTAYMNQSIDKNQDGVVAVSDYTHALPLSLAKAIDLPFAALGTDGFGRSDSRTALREYFEVNADYIVLTSLSLLARQKKEDINAVKLAAQKFGIDLEKISPVHTHWS